MGITEHVARLSRPQVRKLRMTMEQALSDEPAFLENTPRRAVIRVTQGLEPANTQPTADADDGEESLGCVAKTPRVPGKYVAGLCAKRRFESQAGASEKPAVFARLDQVRTSRAPLPF